MPVVDFDPDDPAAVREAYVNAYYSCFGQSTVVEDAILARFKLGGRQPTAEDVATLQELAAGLERVLGGLER